MRVSFCYDIPLTRKLNVIPRNHPTNARKMFLHDNEVPRREKFNNSKSSSSSSFIGKRVSGNYYSSNENKRSSKSLGRPTLLLEATKVLRARHRSATINERERESRRGSWKTTPGIFDGCSERPLVKSRAQSRGNRTTVIFQLISTPTHI